MNVIYNMLSPWWITCLIQHHIYRSNFINYNKIICSNIWRMLYKQIYLHPWCIRDTMAWNIFWQRIYIWKNWWWRSFFMFIWNINQLNRTWSKTSMTYTIKSILFVMIAYVCINADNVVAVSNYNHSIYWTICIRLKKCSWFVCQYSCSPHDS